LENPGKDANTLPEPIKDVKPLLIQGVAPEEEKHVSFQKLKALFLATIQHSLEGNGHISKTIHCLVPEMRVFLPVKEGTTVFHQSWMYAEKQQSIFEEAVVKWLWDDVITLAPVGNPHNNTLTLVAKKDQEGNKTLWHVCLDP